jgi:hypothetical protein
LQPTNAPRLLKIDALQVPASISDGPTARTGTIPGMASPRRRHRTGWIGIALILLNLWTPVLAGAMTRSGWISPTAAGQRIDVCSAGMPMPVEGDAGTDSALRSPGDSHCPLCSHVTLGVSLPSHTPAMTLPARPPSGRMEIVDCGVPRLSAPLMARPRPPPVQTG